MKSEGRVGWQSLEWVTKDQDGPQQAAKGACTHPSPGASWLPLEPSKFHLCNWVNGSPHQHTILYRCKGTESCWWSPPAYPTSVIIIAAPSNNAMPSSAKPFNNINIRLAFKY